MIAAKDSIDLDRVGAGTGSGSGTGAVCALTTASVLTATAETVIVSGTTTGAATGAGGFGTFLGIGLGVAVVFLTAVLATGFFIAFGAAGSRPLMVAISLREKVTTPEFIMTLISLLLLSTIEASKIWPFFNLIVAAWAVALMNSNKVMMINTANFIFFRAMVKLSPYRFSRAFQGHNTG